MLSQAKLSLPVATPSRRYPRCGGRPSQTQLRVHSCASFPATTQQGRNLLTTPSQTEAAGVAAPACPWPRQQQAPKQHGLLSRVWCGMGYTTEATTAAASRLPPEVEDIALFSDRPEVLPEQGWAGLWRYQGP